MHDNTKPSIYKQPKNPQKPVELTTTNNLLDAFSVNVPMMSKDPKNHKCHANLNGERQMKYLC